MKKLIAVLTLSVVLFSCNKHKENLIEGTWRPRKFVQFYNQETEEETVEESAIWEFTDEDSGTEDYKIIYNINELGTESGEYKITNKGKTLVSKEVEESGTSYYQYFDIIELDKESLILRLGGESEYTELHLTKQ
jgi:hypothetical protein